MRYNGIHVRPVRSGRYPGGVVRELDVARYDVNKDGTLTLADLTLLANALVGRVNYPVTSIAFSSATVSLLNRGGTSLKVSIAPSDADYRQVYFTSSNPAVATVDASGNLLATGVGTCTVTVATIDGSNLSASCTVVVKESSAPAGTYVDLDLPSGTLWATKNIGASSPEDYGYYFAWGETEPYSESGKTDFSWSTYKWCNGAANTLTKYCKSSFYGTVDNKMELELSDDAAYVLWGTDWRMPSVDQFAELINSAYTTQEWTTQNGVNGYRITSLTNGNSIFLPAAGEHSETSLDSQGAWGYYWSRTLEPYNSNTANPLRFSSASISQKVNDQRYNGHSIRPVLAQ